MKNKKELKKKKNRDFQFRELQVSAISGTTKEQGFELLDRLLKPPSTLETLRGYGGGNFLEFSRRLWRRENKLTAAAKDLAFTF